MLKSLYSDFEFNRVVEEKVNLVSCVTYDPHKKQIKKWWLHNNLSMQKKLAEYLKTFDIQLSFAAIAECRSFIALGLDPLQFKWIDFFLEYRMMTNHNDKLQWGKQLVNGKVKYTRKPKPKWERTEEDAATGFKATHSLAEATYKLTGEIRDTAHKTKMRDLIISDPKEFTAEEKDAILKYGVEDVIFLPKIWKRLKEEFSSMFSEADMQEYFKEALWRGRYSAHTAWMETRGYPLDITKTKNFSASISAIMHDIQREITTKFPDVAPFRWNKKESRYSMDTKAIKQWIRENNDENRWMKTDGGDLSLALDAWTKFYDFKHHYPADNFGAQMVRFLKLKQTIYGFTPKKPGSDKRGFWDHVGSDGRVRPYMNIYGAQSSRSQPGSTGFMFLKPAWMRALVQPKKGMFCASIDYGQQEFFVAALDAEDPKMIEAYLSGDPYLYQAKLAGAIPPEGTKSTHPEIRDLFKNTTLGISYLMTKYGLAVKLTNDTGREWSEDEAQEQIDIFYDNFEILHERQMQIQEEYSDGGCIKLPCGWYMWSDNENLRSVTNVPIQGFGASVMRKAVDLAHAKGVTGILFTLHDAIYIEGKIGEEWQIVALRDAMTEAFMYYWPYSLKQVAAKIKLDPFAWSPNYKKDGTLKVKGWEIPCSNLYVDDRSIIDYNAFSPYFEERMEDLL